ncbi:alkaline phosphatase family protein [Metallumcola ferriviriculae]|uniref:Alkaline phosphatase family protein n=1 Tax=Metallumcola ferriviriculae TaxID=3039180 RepID=A0AAU0UPF3_9FIRM|nr:alkaline phosphatase family protein [Desulfitibacteraceae bacterium MK1]
MEKKVVLCVIDSFNPIVLEDCFRRDWVPALQFLRNNGFYHKDCVSVFPTMTPTAAASIATGHHPDRHGIGGFIWYHPTEKRIVNYGATPMAIKQIGAKQVIKELIYNLNTRHLSPSIPTLYEALNSQGVSSGCINFFVNRGYHSYDAVIPFSLRLLTRFQLKTQSIKGPDELILGKVVCPKWLNPKGAPAAPWNKFGVNDLFSGYALKEMIKKDRLPSFTLAYFPDTDAMAHDHGPMRTHKSIRRVDRQLAGVLNLFGSWDKALEEIAFIVVGDHSQTLIGKSRRHLIDLVEKFDKLDQLRLGSRHQNETLAISPNERMAIVNFPTGDTVIRETVIRILARDYRISQVMWKQGDEYRVVQGGSGRKLAFKPGGNYWDRYNQDWSWHGDLKVLDMRLQDCQLVDGDYPNAFYRVKAALESSPGAVFLSALPGYEFKGEHAPLHPGGGSHGSLHKEDSLVPLIIAGLEKDISNPRITSFMSYLTDHFAVKLEHPQKLKTVT